MGWLFLEEEVNKETRTADEAVADGRCYGFGAVSYTHLDVYKRQDLHRSFERLHLINQNHF